MIPAFYKDRDIFITGGSGVVGKAVIERLLRSLNVRKIYLLMRPKKGATSQERLDVLKEDPIFRSLIKEKPYEFDEKVVLIPGDVQLPLLGITPIDAKLLENVSIVFHGAATVRFNESLKDAIRLNVGGTLEALRFAETLSHLEVFMHVSTFYSNPYLEFVETKWYEAPMDWKFCLDLSMRNDIPDETLEVITKKLIVGFPNTYTFTKNLAEALVNDYRYKLPAVIYRPSFIICAGEYPEPGYPTGLTTPMGVFALAGAGIVKTLYLSKEVTVDISTLDTVVACMMYYAKKSANIYAEGTPAAIPVLHTSMCTHSDRSLAEVVDIYQRYGCWEEAALEKSLLIPGVKCTDSRLLYMFLLIFQQLLPALLVDLLLILSGRKPVLMAIQRKIFTLMELVTPILFNPIKSNGISYYHEMIDELRGPVFNTDLLIDMDSIYIYYRIVRENSYREREISFKEDPSTLPRARNIMKAKIMLYKAVKILLAFKLYNIIMPRLFNWQWSVVDHGNATELTI